MKKIVSSILILLTLMSCSDSSETASDKISVYYFQDSNKDSLVAVSVEASEENLDEKVKKALDLLYSPEDDDYFSVFPSGMQYESFSLSGSTCTVTLPPRYLTLAPISRIAIDSSLVKTLCSVEYIDSVIISCDNTTKEYRNDDIVIKSPGIYYSTRNVTLYFANNNFTNLRKVTKNIPIQQEKSLEYTVISTLFNKPNSRILQSPIPSGTKLNSVLVEDEICYIDLSSEFVENATHTKTGEAIAIYSIVNTVTELPLINNVKFLIDGAPAYGFTHFDLSKPLTNRSDLFE